jgi:hypothetical protein
LILQVLLESILYTAEHYRQQLYYRSEPAGLAKAETAAAKSAEKETPLEFVKRFNEANKIWLQPD